jgi:hypothetical protein
MYHAVYSTKDIISKINNFGFLSKMPSKWFDWLKCVLIIGSFSYIEQENPNSLLNIIISISYFALLFDSYIFIYNSLNELLSKPAKDLQSENNILKNNFDLDNNNLNHLINDCDTILKKAKPEDAQNVIDIKLDAEKINIIIKDLNHIHKISDAKLIKMININKIASGVIAIALTYDTYKLINFILYMYISNLKKP